MHACFIMSDFATPWTTTSSATAKFLCALEFSRQECWSGLPFPTPGDLFDPGIKAASPLLAGRFLITEPPGSHDQNPKERTHFGHFSALHVGFTCLTIRGFIKTHHLFPRNVVLGLPKIIFILLQKNFHVL